MQQRVILFSPRDSTSITTVLIMIVPHPPVSSTIPIADRKKVLKLTTEPPNKRTKNEPSQDVHPCRHPLHVHHHHPSPTTLDRGKSPSRKQSVVPQRRMGVGRRGGVIRLGGERRVARRLVVVIVLPTESRPVTSFQEKRIGVNEHLLPVGWIDLIRINTTTATNQVAITIHHHEYHQHPIYSLPHPSKTTLLPYKGRYHHYHLR